jgi:hypothetical protein
MRLVSVVTRTGLRLWAALEDDRRSLGLKIALIVLLLLAAALLEAPR